MSFILTNARWRSMYIRLLYWSSSRVIDTGREFLRKVNSNHKEPDVNTIHGKRRLILLFEGNNNEERKGRETCVCAHMYASVYVGGREGDRERWREESGVISLKEWEEMPK